jgi:hypothetical protein
MGVLTECNCAAGPWHTGDIPQEQDAVFLVDYGEQKMSVLHFLEDCFWVFEDDFFLEVLPGNFKRWARIRK